MWPLWEPYLSQVVVLCQQWTRLKVVRSGRTCRDTLQFSHINRDEGELSPDTGIPNITQIVYVSRPGPPRFDYTHHVLIYVPHTDSSWCYFGWRLLLLCICSVYLSLTHKHISLPLCLLHLTAPATLPLSVFHGLTFLGALWLQTEAKEQHNPEIVIQPETVGRKIPRQEEQREEQRNRCSSSSL